MKNCMFFSLKVKNLTHFHAFLKQFFALSSRDRGDIPPIPPLRPALRGRRIKFNFHMGEGSVKLALKMHCHGRNLKIFSAAAESGTAGYKNKIKLSFF